MKYDTSIMRERPQHLLKGEALFKALVRHSADIFILTNNHFQFNFISDAVTKTLGYYPDELVGRTGFEIIHPDDREIFAIWLSELEKSSTTVTPLEFRAKPSIGNWVYLEATGENLCTDDDVNALLIICKDIQAKKVADDALMQAEQRLTLLLNNTKESFIILDSRLRVVAYNKAAQESSPYFFNQELQSGLSFTQLVNAAEVDDYISLLEKVTEEKEQVKDTFYTDPEGKPHIYHHIYRLMNLGGEGHGIFITSADITEKWQTEVALKESEVRFKTIIEYSFDAVVIIDENAIVKYASPSVTGLVGFEPEELIGRSGFDFMHPDDIPEVQSKLASIINNDDETFADYRSITKDGGLKWVEAKGKNMFNNPHIRGILVSFRDIGQRKQMLEEQLALTNELTKYNKDLQQFSFITSHNLRAPVANLQSLLSLFNREKLDDAFNKELLEKFDDCISQLNDTLTDLINVLVIRSTPNADAEYIRFDEVTKQVMKNIQSLLRDANGTIATNFTTVEGTEYNRVHLESVFLNLISNAIKYASPERQLMVSITSELTPEGVRLAFSDNGIGIDLSRYGDRIFGMYQRFHAGKQGKGLGLYMIKSQILASGGSIKVQSEPGVGTTFFVHLKKGVIV
jgi:PAS domain S-box-containing protein